MENSILDQIKNSKLVILDADGVLVEENTLLPYALEFVSLLKKLGKKTVIFTNNSTRDPYDLHQYFANLGFDIDDFVTSSLLSVNYCLNNDINTVFIVGEEGLLKVFEKSGIECNEEKSDAVIVGMDRNLTYNKLAIATRHIRNGSIFIGTNPDKNVPTPRGLEPGAGSMIAAIEASTGTKPEIILGKPAKWGYQYILDNFNISNKDAVMIGDRFETDIIGALNSNIPALIVATGVSAHRKNPGKYKAYPEVEVVNNLGEIINFINNFP